MSDSRQHLYFAYASNLCPIQMAARCPGHDVVGPAVLRGWRFGFPRRADDWEGAGVAGIGPGEASDAVEGVVFRVDDRHLATLDDYEAVDEGHYVRQMVEVEPVGAATGGAGPRPIEVATYVAIPEPGGPFPPSRRYLDTILRGARHHGLSAAWIARLEGVEVAKP